MGEGFTIKSENFKLVGGMTARRGAFFSSVVVNQPLYHGATKLQRPLKVPLRFLAHIVRYTQRLFG